MRFLTRYSLTFSTLYYALSYNNSSAYLYYVILYYVTL